MSALSTTLASVFKPRKDVVAESVHHDDNVLAWNDSPTKPIPRYLQLARSIHSRITAKEEKEMAVYRAAEALAARKNEVVMRAVQEVVDFCNILGDVPELNDMLDKKVSDITNRIFSNRATFTVEHEPIAVSYEAPLYHVDMHMPDHIRLTGCDTAYIQIGFNPVTFVLVDKDATEKTTITKHLLRKHYRINADGVFLYLDAQEPTPADPIADILTDLRLKLGHEFFEAVLMPHLENQGASPLL